MSDYVKWFRHSTPYINTHRDRTFVVLLPGEAIANAFPGVKGTFAIQAGREIRVIVDPQAVGDNEAMLMAREIGRRIEAELRYPGQIRVVVIREQRCIEYAR